MKKLMFIALALAAGISFAADYSPSSLPANTNQPDVMPGMVNFQGLLRDPATGNVYANGLYDLECRIYTSVSSSAKPLWGAKYQAYVRDGYFNIMLGSSANELSGCTYKSTELWKALWYDTQNRELYLGVTPWQRANGSTIEDAKDRVEVLPRQQLLASPFSFRAHKAQYADAATGNFTVKGDLSVNGQILNNGKSFGLKNVTATDEAITVGANTASPDKTTMQGRTVNIESGDGLNLTAGGDATVTTTLLAALNELSVRVTLPEAATDTLRLRSASESPVNWTRSIETTSSAPGAMRVDVRTRHTSPSAVS